MRLRGSTTAQAMADRPYRFLQRPHREGTSIIAPRMCSERRKIIPMGFLDSGTVISDQGCAVYDAELWLFALLQSRMHTAWVGTVGGKLKTDYRYSAVLCYNTFPVPPLANADRARLTEHALDVLAARERHSDRTLGSLYLPHEMPPDLKRVHEQLDATVDALYGASAYADRHGTVGDPVQALRRDDRGGGVVPNLVHHTYLARPARARRLTTSGCARCRRRRSPRATANTCCSRRRRRRASRAR